MRRNGGVGRPGHVAGELGRNSGKEGRLRAHNAALPVLDSGQGCDAEVEEALARLLASWLGRRRRGKLGRSCRFAAELAEDEGGEERELWVEMRLAGARGGIVASKRRCWG